MNIPTTYPMCCSKDNGDALGLNQSLSSAISNDGNPTLEHVYTVPARCGCAVRLKKGQIIRIVTNQRRPIGTLLTDTSPGIHDTLIAACDLHRYTNLGVSGYHDSCADNMRLALKAIGLRAKEVPQPLNLWMNIPVNPDNTISWLPTVSKAGDYIEIRAELNCVVVMSACPQDIIPINNCTPQPVHFQVMNE
ncbi:urea carboxylase-associated family protein [Acinetobacter rathckeae]|uniref:urea carboxylase-associated family protein n=1 Tax=Acinetobacter rathckeae TaxID=2605272 RepID=UPI002B1BD318|nr:urea carboxylase-associated family protein [Acinetobacter rathckeae]